MKTNGQRVFILNEIFAATLGATVQRSKTYKDNTTEKERNSFQKSLRLKLEKLAQLYISQVPESQHLDNIAFLAETLSTEHSSVLFRSRFRIGSAQKALNLYLKYLWCLGLIEQPPHCPIDAIVLAKLVGRVSTRWTILDSLSEYEEVIAAAKLKAGEIPLSIWELELWNGTQSA
jgi:hypothetical protein